MKYNVSFFHKHVGQSNIANAESSSAVYAWYKMYKPDARILSISPASVDDEKPGKPVIDISNDYLPYIHAAENMSLILQHERNMRCEFYVMDKRYMNNLAFPKFSFDSRGHQLQIGDWYVIITCANDYKYYVNVTSDSVVTMCAETFGFIQYK